MKPFKHYKYQIHTSKRETLASYKSKKQAQESLNTYWAIAHSFQKPTLVVR